MPKTAPAGGTDAGLPLGVSLRISSEALPRSERVGFFREFFSRKVLRIDLEPLSDEFRAELIVKVLPSVGMVWGRNSAIRTGPSQDAEDGFVLQIARSKIEFQQLGREGIVEPGQAITLSNADRGQVTFPSKGEFVSIFLPRAPFEEMLRHGKDCFAQSLAKTSPALQLLRGYVDLLRDDSTTATTEAQQLTATHIQDLAALALGARHDAAELAKNRGVRAARLHAIKKDVLANLDRDISLDEIAARHRISPRYVRMLFEGEMTSFSEFVRTERLSLAHCMLRNRNLQHLRIADIAYEVGFGDVSYFNRLFRRQFGVSPGDVRQHGVR